MISLSLARVVAIAITAAALAGACRGSSDNVGPATPQPPLAGDTVRQGGDWPMFGYVPARTSEGPDSTGITASNASTLQRRQVQLPGTVDSSPIYLRQA